MGFLKKIVKSVKKVANGDFLGAAGSVASAVIGSKAAKNASNAQVNASKYAAQLQQQQFDKQLDLQRSQFDRTAAINEQQFNKQLELNAPFREAGLSAQNRLMQLYGLGPNTSGADYGSAMRDFSAADFQVDPGYAFRQQQGEQGMERSAAARGGLLSGGAIKDAQRFNQGLASAEFGDAYNRFQTNRANRINPLQSLMGSGQSATGQLTNVSQNYANNAANAGQNYANNATNASQNYAINAGNAAMGAGNARASGYMGQANAISDALGQGINNFSQNRLLRRGVPYVGRSDGLRVPTFSTPITPQSSNVGEYSPTDYSLLRN
ncbi:MAG: hypothetical protein WCR59_00565 [Planctomycetota bacterium]